MFSLLRQSITRQVNRVRREFQEVIRPVADRVVENFFERYRQKGKKEPKFITFRKI